MVAKKPVKKTVKKSVAKKATPVKKAVTKKPATRKSAAKRTRSSKRDVAMQSFRIYKETAAFNNFSVTRQTVYWIILLTVIVIMQLWVLKIQLEIAELTTILLSQQ